MELGPIFRAMVRNRARFALVVLEVALTLAIVANCVGLILEARAEMTRESGFVDDQLIWVRTTNFGPDYEDETFVEMTHDRDMEALRAMPGVEEVSATFFLPWQGGGSSGEVLIEGTTMERVRTQTYTADPRVWETLGVEIVAGRNFDEADMEADPDGDTFHVIVSRGLADLLFPDSEPLGQVLQFNPEGNRYPIIGVFDPFYNPYGWPIEEYAVFFAGDATGSSGTSFLVRAAPGKVDEVFGDLEETLLAVDPGRNFIIRTISEIRSSYHTSDRVLVGSLNVVMGLLLLVTCLGIVGITAFSVAERRRQIGTRRALGAKKRDIVRYFLMENWIVTSIGVLLGAGMAFGLNVWLVHAMDGRPLDPWIVTAGAIGLWLIGLASTLGPALRGAKVQPATATRTV